MSHPLTHLFPLTHSHSLSLTHSLFLSRPMYEADGHFAMFHVGNWQHAMMYGGVAVSGLVDLIGYYVPLPAGTEQVGVL